MFDRSPIYLVKVDQINALASHDGGRIYNQVDHPQAAHRLLGYINTNSSFTKRRKKKRRGRRLRSSS